MMSGLRGTFLLLWDRQRLADAARLPKLLGAPVWPRLAWAPDTPYTTASGARNLPFPASYPPSARTRCRPNLHVRFFGCGATLIVVPKPTELMRSARHRAWPMPASYQAVERVSVLGGFAPCRCAARSAINAQRLHTFAVGSCRSHDRPAST
jgi:hypothetical protein